MDVSSTSDGTNQQPLQPPSTTNGRTSGATNIPRTEYTVQTTTVGADGIRRRCNHHYFVTPYQSIFNTAENGGHRAIQVTNFNRGPDVTAVGFYPQGTGTSFHLGPDPSGWITDELSAPNQTTRYTLRQAEQQRTPEATPPPTTTTAG